MLDGEDRTESPKMLSLRRYVHPKNAGFDYLPDPPVAEEDECPVLRNNQRLEMPRKGVYATIETGTLTDEINEEGGLRAMAWDESTGRIVMASEDGLMIRIVDCSKSAMPDARSETWQRRREILYEGRPGGPLADTAPPIVNDAMREWEMSQDRVNDEHRVESDSVSHPDDDDFEMASLRDVVSLRDFQ